VGKELGEFLKGAREMAGISQSELAEKLGLKSAQSISNIERGVAPLPQSQIKDVARILELDAADIVEIIVEEVRDRYLKIVDTADKNQEKAKGKSPGLLARKAKADK
jgi:transcriptional regulator with XRE-family HTH domain